MRRQIIVAFAVFLSGCQFSNEISLEETVESKKSQSLPIEPNTTCVVHVSKLQGACKIIGRLGQPAGVFFTLKGVWKKGANRWHEDQLFLHVLEVNEEQVDPVVVFSRENIVDGSLYSESARPDPKEFESWEVRAYEQVEHRGTPSAFWVEAGLEGPEQRVPPFELRSTLVYVRPL